MIRLGFTATNDEPWSFTLRPRRMLPMIPWGQHLDPTAISAARRRPEGNVSHPDSEKEPPNALIVLPAMADDHDSPDPATPLMTRWR
jgi:hypothetical protein